MRTGLNFNVVSWKHVVGSDTKYKAWLNVCNVEVMYTKYIHRRLEFEAEPIIHNKTTINSHKSIVSAYVAAGFITLFDMRTFPEKK